MKFKNLLIGLLFLVFFLLVGCSGKQLHTDTRPKLMIFVCEQLPMALRTYPELDRLIATNFDYEIVEMGGGYDRQVAQADYEKWRELPYSNKSISFEDYLMLRDDDLRLRKQDIRMLEKYDLQQTPMIITFDHNDQETGRFTKMRSDEIRIRVAASVTEGKIPADGAVKGIEPGWKLTNDKDRQALYSWLYNKVAQ